MWNSTICTGALVLLCAGLFPLQLSAAGSQEPEGVAPDGEERSAPAPEAPRPEIEGPRIEPGAGSRATAETEIRVGSESHTVAASAYLWRDFMPSVNGSGPSGINGTVTLESMSRREWPDTLEVTSVELSSEGSSWKPAEFRVRTGEAARERIVEFSEGPKWSTEKRVRLIVMLRADQETADVVFSDVSIQKTQ